MIHSYNLIYSNRECTAPFLLPSHPDTHAMMYQNCLISNFDPDDVTRAVVLHRTMYEPINLAFARTEPGTSIAHQSG